MAQNPTAWKLAERTWYTWGQTDVTAEVTKIAQANPDFVWLYVYSSAQAIPAVQRLRELGYKGDIAVDWEAASDGQIAASGGALMEGVVSYGGWMPDPKIPESIDFYNKYVAYANSRGKSSLPGDYAVSEYIGVHAYAKALEAVGSPDDNNKVIDAIYNLSNAKWITARGNEFKIMPGGLQLDPGMYIQIMKGGKVEIHDFFPLTEKDFGEPYIPPGNWKTLLQLEQEGKK